MNYQYFSGQVFNLDQETMNKMIDDVRELKEKLKDREYNIKALEVAATLWMNYYQKLKDKYEPLVAVISSQED